MEQEGTRPHPQRTRGAKWQGVAVLAVLTLMLSACMPPTQRVAAEAEPAQGFGRITGHGGGVAIMNSGEYVVIRPNGSISERCYMCAGPHEREAACQRTAERRGIPMCHPPAAPAAQPAMLTSGGASDPDAPRARSGVMCQVYGPSGPLPALQYNPGWPYWCNYKSGAAPSCTCYRMQ